MTPNRLFCAIKIIDRFTSWFETNKAGTTYGNEIKFSTSPNISLATITTATVTNITSTTATLGGNVTSDGNSAVTERGTCVSTSPSPTTAQNKFSKGTGIGSFSSDITGFTAGTSYYVRAYAINSMGTVYGNEVSFITTVTSGITGTVSDSEGNSYKTISIGTQVWMAENLKSTKCKDGTAINLVTDPLTWEFYPNAAYCWYDNNASNKSVYGALYNWAAVNTGKLCPTGWHVPSDAEWTTLTTFLGGTNVAAGKMKETGTSHWTTPNTAATNTSGFTALPGGSRGGFGSFSYMGNTAIWWSSKESSPTEAFRRYMYYNYADIYGGGSSKQFGFSVRCVKD